MKNWIRRHLFRLLFVVFCGTLALGIVPNLQRGVEFLPRLSPLLNLGGAVASRQFLGWSLLFCVPLLLLPLWKGRFFCWRICPMGFLAEMAGKLNPRGKGLIKKIPAVNQILAWILIVTAVVGYPLYLWLDPLCIFNGFFAAWREPLTWATSVTGIGFLSILVVSVIAPNIWCHRLCPLGGLEEGLDRLSRRLRTKKEEAKAVPGSAPLSRRAMIAAIPAGLAGLAANRGLANESADVVRPPTASKRFNALCARCGNCMRVCPDQLIQPDFGESGIGGLFTPVIRFRSRNENQESYCFQDCVLCTTVCPTGALHPITAEIKKEVKIGLAQVDHNRCIAWKDHEYCVVCDEYCPFKAIRVEKHNGVMCPIVDAAKCRGCGACESQCPALPIAITIHPIKKEK